MSSPKEISKEIEATLNELADTQSKLALRQVRSLLYAAFEKHSDGYGEAVSYVPKMIDISVDRRVVQSATTAEEEPATQSVPATVRVPLVTLMPIKLLGIKKVQLSNQVEEDYLEDSSEGDGLSIDVTYDECPLPDGLERVLNILANTIEPISGEG